jgi:hypothetical protein
MSSNPKKAASSAGPMFGLPAYQTAMMSCMLCGKHRAKTQMQMRRLLGRARWVCLPSCRQADPAP